MSDTLTDIRADLYDLHQLVGIGDSQLAFLLERIAAVMERGRSDD